ncbi:MAG TPA: hypothetical protein VLH39_05080 [Magnetospirillaceae bacterium]|nr:hypothetical protein [Magnetospirillaceae bacterium]
MITFQGSTVDEIDRAFRESVDNYLTLEGVLASEPDVRFAYLFGSAVEGGMGPRSDVDLVNLNRSRSLPLLDRIVRRGAVIRDRDPKGRFDGRMRRPGVDGHQGTGTAVPGKLPRGGRSSGLARDHPRGIRRQVCRDSVVPQSPVP